MTEILKSFADLKRVIQPEAPAPHKSGSTKIVEYLSKLDGDQIDLTARELAERVGCSEGAASGFLSKQVGRTCERGKGRKSLVNYIIQLEPYHNGEVRARNIKGSGGKPGREKGPTTLHRAPRDKEPLPLASAVAFPDVPSALRHYADLLESVRPLSAYSDDEILDEFKRRLHSRS